MKTFISTLLLIFLFACIVSCEKDETKPKRTSASHNEKTVNEYTQLKVGNYWIYEHFEVDTAGNATPLNEFDSCYVEKDTMINGNTYLKLYKPLPLGLGSFYPEYSFVRDSLDYIVDESGTIMFSSEDFDTYFYQQYESPQNDTLFSITQKMEDFETIVNTPAGDFNTLNAKITITYHSLSAPHGLNPRYRHSRYAKNIGLVVETLLFPSNQLNTVERRLVRYHLN